MKFSILAISLCVSFKVGLSQTCPSLLWSDEFTGTSLDDTKWSPQIGNGCDQGPGLCAWGNNELQYYSEENVEVSGGTLKITAKRENKGDNSYTSARLRSLGLYDVDLTQPHVRLEARIKVPAGQGLWPAFWLMPSPMVLWPTGGEIDVMEFIGREPKNAHGYFHYGNLYNDKHRLGGPLALPEDVSDDFHVFSFEKEGREVRWFLDGYMFESYKESDLLPKFSWPFEGDFHFLLNFAVGGNWPLYPDASTQFPAVMEVDYVRVWDMSGSSAGGITGKTLVHDGTTSVTYCVEGNDFPLSSFSWQVPSDATFVDNGSCIDVTFGSMSGFIQVTAQSSCSFETYYSIPVHVQSFYEKEFAVVDISSDTTNIGISTGSQSIVSVGGSPALRYGRSGSELYDNIIIEDISISDADSYVLGERRFFMDVKCDTCAQCTRVIIQLEHATTALPTNYPNGRHSRYEAFIDTSLTGFQRLEFKFYDRPDKNVETDAVDEIVVLFDGFNYRNDVYHLRNFDSAIQGCTSDCEALSTNMCKVYAKSEEGMCQDGINNDREGYDGDSPTDCMDGDCYDLDPACRVTETGLCADGIDNDGDGLMDCFDPDCANDEACAPTSSPTLSPTSNPTASPTTSSPSASPTAMPTSSPSQSPTFSPTHQATMPPNGNDPPTSSPSFPPPTKSPSSAPTMNPSVEPTLSPTTLPTQNPTTVEPSFSPTTLSPTSSPTAGPSASMMPTFENNSPMCIDHPKCVNLTGVCCPTVDFVLLECCSNRPDVDPNIESSHCDDGIDNDNDGLVDCDDPECSNNPICRQDCPATEVGSCENLDGPCCPTVENVFLACCDQPTSSSGYVKEFSFIGPVDLDERASYFESSGPYDASSVAPNGDTPVVSYRRQEGEAFDLIYFSTSAIANASHYVPLLPGGDPLRKFYIDFFNTGELCTTLLLQLETLPRARNNDYPIGRHSRYRCPLTKTSEWERVMCTYFDSPDPTVGDTEITHLAMFVDPGDKTNNRMYFFRNFDSVVAGCTSNCEPTTEDICAGNIDGEEGQCNDGIDNDFDTKADCADPNCILDEACGAQLVSSLASVSDREVGAIVNGVSSTIRLGVSASMVVAILLSWTM